MLCPSCGTDSGDVAKFCPSCGASIVRVPTQNSDPMIGRIIADKFRVEALLGEGGMGMVYKATQVNLDKLVVLKVLRPSLVSDERTVARFQREAKAASRLNHPNSIGVIDFGQATDDGSMYIAMEYCPGRDLHHIITQEWPLEEPRIVRIVSQVLSALGEAHANGVIHRDLKPENIMVEQRRGEPDFVKVLDFGIAKIQDQTTEDGPALTRAGFVCGTPEYMSPEQAKGGTIDHRSDLYAIGVILYQMVTQMLPFDSESAVGFATAHLTQEPPALRKRRPEARCSPALERLIARSMGKDPMVRPQTAEAFRAELLDLAPGASSLTVPTGPGFVDGPSEQSDVTAGEASWGDKTPADTGQVVSAVKQAEAKSLGRTRAAQRSNPSMPSAPPPPAVAPPELPEKTSAGSKAPLIAVVLGAVLLLGGGGFYAMSGKAKPTDDLPAVAIAKMPDPVVKPLDPTKPPGPEEKLTGLKAEGGDPDVPAAIQPYDPDASHHEFQKAKEAFRVNFRREDYKAGLYRAWQRNPKNTEVLKQLGVFFAAENPEKALYWFKQYQDIAHDPNIDKTIEEIRSRLPK